MTDNTRQLADDSSIVFNLTHQEKILLALMAYRSYSDEIEVPKSITQEGISRKVGIKQKHVPRNVLKLEERGLLTKNRCHVTGVKQKRIAYFLTDDGYQIARQLHNNIVGCEISVKNSDGSVSMCAINQLPLFKDHILDIIDIARILEEYHPFDMAVWSDPEERSAFLSPGETDDPFSGITTVTIGDPDRESIMKSALEQAWRDGILTSDEQAMLEDLKSKLNMSPRQFQQIEDSVLKRLSVQDRDPQPQEIYKEALDEALADGVFTRDEWNILSRLRQTLNISLSDHARLEAELRAQEPVDKDC